MIKNKSKTAGLNRQVGFKLDAQNMQKLESLAREQRRPVGQLCRIVIEDFLNAPKNGASAAS